MFERIEVASPTRPWATALAFLVNSTALVLAILVPMLKPDQLPAFVREVTTPISMPHNSSQAPVRETGARRPIADQPTDSRVIHVPPSIPIGVDMHPDKPSVDSSGPYYEGPVFPNNITVNTLPLVSNNPPPVAVTTKPPRPQTLVISHLDEGMLIRRVQPTYPFAAKATHTQGTVVLSALISTHGEIEGLQVISGSPLLAQAAIEAVRQWRYRPYILNGSPIEVRTQVTVNFSLQ